MPRAICKYCRQEIQWIRTVKGKLMPCEMDRKVIMDRQGRVHGGFESHYAHCPQAEQARRAHQRKRMVTHANHYAQR
jgi:hypothetical protein